MTKQAIRMALAACVVAGVSGCAAMATGSASATASASPAAPPHLAEMDGMTKLIVDGQPFICVAGELMNSTSSDFKAIQSILPRLAQAHLNTVLSVVSWDLIEPREGEFDFSMIDNQLKAARANHLRLILLWMGSWKNGLSHYPPAWVKANQARFPRVVNADGSTLEILSTLSEANRDADARAFAAVMKHLREVDSKDHTVIAMQVENEAGVLGSARDFCDAANKAYNGPVPAQLMGYLEAHKDHLLPEFKAVWDAAGDKTSGTWEEVFGKNVPRQDRPVPNSPGRSPRPAGAELVDHTDEIFMAWNYSRYIGYVAAAGKKAYALPMYVNTWIVQPEDRGPGDYPSGGAEPLVQDVWRAGAPAIDILAPDIYLPQYAEILKTFSRNGNPAFNPETRANGDLCWEAFTQLKALCFSPFGIDNLNPDSAFARTYGFVNSISGALAAAQGKTDALKLITLKPGENPGKVTMGEYTFDFTSVTGGRRGGAGNRGARPANHGAADENAGAASDSGSLSFMQAPFVLIIHTAPDLYYFASNGNYPFRVLSNDPDAPIAGPAGLDRGQFEDGRWVTSRRLNGDDLMRGGYDLSGAAAKHEDGTVIPLGPGRGFRGGAGAADSQALPTVLRARFYHYR